MIETDRLVAPDPSDGREEAVDRAIRPRRLDDYIGQTAVREQMEIFLSAARARGEPLDHTLIFGPPGLGKTTLASIIAEEMGVQLKTTSGPILEKAGDIAALMTNLRARRRALHRRDSPAEPPRRGDPCTPPWRTTSSDIMIGEGSRRAVHQARFTAVSRSSGPPPVLDSSRRPLA